MSWKYEDPVLSYFIDDLGSSHECGWDGDWLCYYYYYHYVPIYYNYDE